MSEIEANIREMLRLPFVRDLRAGRRRVRCFWHVEASGDYVRDLECGGRYAVEYLRCPARPSLQWIVKDMPRELTGIEINFLRIIAAAATAAPHVADALLARDREFDDRARGRNIYYLRPGPAGARNGEKQIDG